MNAESVPHHSRGLLRSTPRSFARQSAVLILALLIGLSAFAIVVSSPTVTAASDSNIASYRVDGAVNFTDPGSESFWSPIPPTDVPLSASISPGGGHTPDVQIKSANDGYNVYVLFRWNDSQGASFESNEEVWKAQNGTLMPLNPEDTINVTQLFFNDTYYYQDRAALLWFLPQSLGRDQTPRMDLGTDGAISGGAAEIWHWQSNPTDNNPLDTGFPGGYTDSLGNPIYPADNLSFAEDDYANTTGFFTVAGNFGAGAPNLVPEADPFLIHVGSLYDPTSKTWTVEMVRSFTTSQTAPYCVQLTPGVSYYVAFATWNGRLGESSAYKSVSQWYTLTISNQTVAQAPAPEGGISLTVAAGVGIGMLFVGIMIGVVVRSFRKEEDK